MHSLPPSSPAASVTTPAKCGSSSSTLIPHQHDKHPFTCEDDKTDSWTDGWTRQPPGLFRSPLVPQAQHADPASGHDGSLRFTRICRTGLVTVTKYGSDPISADVDSHERRQRVHSAEHCTQDRLSA